MKEFVASFVYSVQVTEDSWERTRPSLKVNANTTIGDIHEWWKKHQKSGVMEIEIFELQTK